MTHARPAEWRQLTGWCAKHGLRLSEVHVDQLRAYLDVLQLWNRKLALVAQTEPSQIICKHFADSLFAASQCTDGESVVDLGSGAGFPGLPIAIARPASRVCLIESRGKKASFLEQACLAASVRNVVVCNARIESAAEQIDQRRRYSVATSRALTSTSRFFDLALPFLHPGGRAMAMRSTSEGSDADPPNVERIHYELPDGTPRRLVIARR